MHVRKLFPPYREKGREITAAAVLPGFEIAGITVLVHKKVRHFSEPKVCLRTAEGTVFPLTRREYVLVTIHSQQFMPQRGSFASLSVYFTASGYAMIRNCPNRTKLELSVRIQPDAGGRGKIVFRPANYSKHIELTGEELNIL